VSVGALGVTHLPYSMLIKIQGGLVIFDKEGNARYAYEEETGTPLDIGDIVAALKKIRDE
jgi:hypothetical protein